ncbi:acetyl esterase/lipase [Microbacterium trichothecenolyticum]|uniref:alpha/beta hydrolase n=1 Tax=Microbacterium trichothecenolyticum TaxID=69370 RepID=UPI002858DC0B|nr:prolyl oligopeptidase family serine peptidase [Microbacterium trichothecenolyticum]MDR7110734.1 acetyl esterase/lipase [Microbacterium trichothecenolyticum]
MPGHALVLPGGSYRSHAPHEADPVADWLGSLGIPASVFRYPLGQPHPAAHAAVGARIADLRRAGVERVLLVGFSAGGHAAGLAALDAVVPTARPDAVILGYPVVSLTRHSHQGSSEVLLGGRDTDENRSALSLEARVTADAPPFFVFHSLDDEKVPVEHSLLLSEALRRERVAHELHLYPVGGHGCALGGPGVDWTAPCERWLRDGAWIEKTIPG